MRVFAAAAISLFVFASSQSPQRITITRSGSQPTINGPAQNFTGSARIVRLWRPTDPARTSVSSVTFEPGARTAWHTHPLGQILENLPNKEVEWLEQVSADQYRRESK